MSIAQAVQLRELKQELEALVALVKALAAEVDELKAQQAPRRGRPPKESNEQR